MKTKYVYCLRFFMFWFGFFLCFKHKIKLTSLVDFKASYLKVSMKGNQLFHLFYKTQESM